MAVCTCVRTAYPQGERCRHPDCAWDLRPNLSSSLLQRAERILQLCVRVHHGESGPVLAARHRRNPEHEEEANDDEGTAEGVDPGQQETRQDVLASAREQLRRSQRHQVIQGLILAEEPRGPTETPGCDRVERATVVQR